MMFAKCVLLVLTLGVVIAHECSGPTSARKSIKKSTACESETVRDPQPELVYSFVLPQYDWPSEETRQCALRNESYIPENNIISGIKVWDGNVYVTVPRWLPGVPASLCKLVTRGSTQPILQPFPDWQWNTIGDCRFLQYVQSMEIDPNTGHMWILDTGRVNTFVPDANRNICPPKLVIYDLISNTEVNRHIFAPDVASPVANFLNDIVLDYIDGRVGFAYIADTTNDDLGPGIVVYNAQRNTSHRIYHESMRGSAIPNRFGSGSPVDGIAMSPDFRFLYYATISTHPIFQVPTAVLRQPNMDISAHVRNIGNRTSLQTDGMVHSKTSLYFGGNMGENDVTRWNVAAAMVEQSVGVDQVSMTRQTVVAHDDVRMLWQDTFSIDESGYLWFVSNNLPGYFGGEFDFSGSRPNFFIWKLNINEMSYLDQRDVPTPTPDVIG